MLMIGIQWSLIQFGQGFDDKTSLDSIDTVFREGDSHDYYLKDIGRATSAAPTYFSPHTMDSIDGSVTQQNMLDGGIFANNATGVALSK